MKKHTDLGEPVASVEVWELTDPTSVQNQIEVLDQDLISLSKKSFSAKRVLVPLNNVKLVFHKSSHRVRSRTRIDSSLVAFLVTGPNSKGTIDGISFCPDYLITVAPGTTADLVAEPGYKSVVLMISRHRIDDLLAGHGSSDRYQLPGKFIFKSCGKRLAQSFFSLCEKVAGAAEKNPKLFDDNRAVRASAETEILDCLKTIIDTSPDSPSSLDFTDGTLPNYSKIIKAVEAHTLVNLDRQVFVRELCQIAGVSERTLQGAFHEIMHMPPAAYLRRLRLHRARADLQNGSKSTTTVSVVALKWGFWHFGEFSKAYGDCFSELPSQTLRRKPKK